MLAQQHVVVVGMDDTMIWCIIGIVFIVLLGMIGKDKK